MGVLPSEFDLIVELMGREPNFTELGMFAVMWSEHCGYKYSRPILAYFKRYKEAMESTGLENAGIIPIGDGLGVAFKIESHNHPSAVEPYQGAATGVGGILRDIFTMGARPIACLNSLRFGPISGEDAVAKQNRYLFEHVVAGIAGYGNCVGVPTVAGEVGFHPRYSGNPLVNAMAVGIVELDKITTAGAGGIGNPVIYLGSATGKDGIHGATFASEELGEDSDAKRPNVQIGDPFAEKLLIEATLEALETGAVHSIQDMGAAGLTCSTIEMSAKGDVGMEINLDKVPMRERDMTAYELMLSESQERMLCVAHKGREREVIEVFEKWGLPAVVVGEVTDSGRVRVYRHGNLECDVNPHHLADMCPVYKQDSAEPTYYREAGAFDVLGLPSVDLNEAFRKLLVSPNIASKQWVYRQYDQQVQTQTKIVPGGGDAAVLAPRLTKAGISVKVDGNALWTYLDPYAGGQHAVLEAARNVACTGARPAGITDGLNFGSPQQPHVYWQFDRAVRGIADAAETIGTPVVSGNVSFYNQSELGEVLPTALIGMLGILDDADDAIGIALKTGDSIAWVGIPARDSKHFGLGASQFLSVVQGIESGHPEAPNAQAEKGLHVFLETAAKRRLLHAAHDISEGGAAICLSEMAFAGNVEFDADLSGLPLPDLSPEESRAFGEWPGVAFVSFSPDNGEHLQGLAESNGLVWCQVGNAGVSSSRIVLSAQTVLNFKLVELRELWEKSLTAMISE
ncbi:MAG: phosphoribosylformylglycinamidine synthase subunit PurL [Chthonomonas sp.]|nr:phosphoribosylformylglycinamidine synthase subunit PurL [Chthonomonas sp.]